MLMGWLSEQQHTKPDLCPQPPMHPHHSPTRMAPGHEPPHQRFALSREAAGQEAGHTLELDVDGGAVRAAEGVEVQPAHDAAVLRQQQALGRAQPLRAQLPAPLQPRLQRRRAAVPARSAHTWGALCSFSAGYPLLCFFSTSLLHPAHHEVVTYRRHIKTVA